MHTFCFIRHAQSVSNILHKGGFPTEAGLEEIKERKLTPNNVPLSEEGYSQAKQAAGTFVTDVLASVASGKNLNEALSDIQIYSSPTERTKITKSIFMEAIKGRYPKCHLHDTVSPHLRERHPGVGFYMTREMFQEKYPEHVHDYSLNRYFAVPPGGESLASREADVYSFLNHAGAGSLGSSLLIAFTHGGFMMALERVLSTKEDPNLIETANNCDVFVVKGYRSPQKPFAMHKFEKIKLIPTE